MNKQEIDDMMKDLPSQQVPKESALERFFLGIIFITVLVFWMWVPDFTLTEEECQQQTPHAITSGLCTEPKAK